MSTSDPLLSSPPDARAESSTAVDSSPGARRSKRSTIEDVAAAAGVSAATVSRALRGLPNVALSTRRRIVEIASELDYVADPAAARLAVGRTTTVTIVIPHLSGWYFSTVVAGAEAVCTEAGYDVLIVGVGNQDDLTRLLDEHHQLERRTDGLLLVELVVSAEESSSIAERGVALASVGSRTPGHPSVRIDNDHVGRLAAEHLLDLGHRRIGMIGAQKDNPLSFDVPALRRRGFTAALAASGVALDDSLIAEGNFGVDGGHEAMATLLDRADPPTAVFSMSDEMAFGALMELDRRNLTPGKDVSLIGVDDHEFARVVDLTTIAQPVADHGAAAARLLLETMRASSGRGPVASDPGAVDHVAPIELVIRRTTGPAPQALSAAPSSRPGASQPVDTADSTPRSATRS